VGTADGFLEGLAVRARVGTLDGAADGRAVGLIVGFFEGPAEGCWVANATGILVGIGEGPAVGLFVIGTASALATSIVSTTTPSSPCEAALVQPQIARNNRNNKNFLFSFITLGK
jgi:hypothetical protein